MQWTQAGEGADVDGFPLLHSPGLVDANTSSLHTTSDSISSNASRKAWMAQRSPVKTSRPPHTQFFMGPLPMVHPGDTRSSLAQKP